MGVDSGFCQAQPSLLLYAQSNLVEISLAVSVRQPKGVIFITTSSEYAFLIKKVMWGNWWLNTIHNRMFINIFHIYFKSVLCEFLVKILKKKLEFSQLWYWSIFLVRILRISAVNTCTSTKKIMPCTTHSTTNIWQVSKALSSHC